MKQQRAVQSGRSIVLLSLMVLAPLAAAAEDDYNIFSRLQELRQEQSAATPMASAETGQSGSRSAAAAQGLKGPVRSDPGDDAVAEQLQRPWRYLGGIGGENTN